MLRLSEYEISYATDNSFKDVEGCRALNCILRREVDRVRFEG